MNVDSVCVPPLLFDDSFRFVLIAIVHPLEFGGDACQGAARAVDCYFPPVIRADDPPQGRGNSSFGFSLSDDDTSRLNHLSALFRRAIPFHFPTAKTRLADPALAFVVREQRRPASFDDIGFAVELRAVRRQ